MKRTKSFYAGVDLRNRESIMEYLRTHPTHDGNYANTIKLHSLSIDPEARDVLGKVLSDDFEAQNIWDQISGTVFEEFAELHKSRYSGGRGHTIHTGGRSGGWLELEGYSKPMSDDDLAEIEFEDLKDEAKLVRDFDKACDAIVDEFIWLGQLWLEEDPA